MTTTTPEAATTMRRCIGSRTFGIEPHQALADTFPTQPSQKDGLGRICKPHWRAYTNALRKAALARKSEAPAETSGSPAEAQAEVAPADEHTLAASLVGEGEPIEAPAPRRTHRAKAQPETEVSRQGGNRSGVAETH